ncbi:unnamed protein product [Psylliodes chrysocephalus]|uniref:Uncharacterized protein n=1 Tax=Psylliodes chrysocephalus TaxID=3402493 RepID=A0A9P0CTK2_9CUCU|nr:unnamed protein product [Psylliodes chrysocephala]
MKCREVLDLELLLLGIIAIAGESVSETQTPHKTKQASEKQHDLWCYKCDTMTNGEKCLDLEGNDTTMHHKCNKEQKKCQVRRISMSTSTDEVTGKPKLWLLQRNCSESCEPGCIVIGERTKLHSCITCCDEHNYCNAGSVAAKTAANQFLVSSFSFLCAFVGFRALMAVAGDRRVFSDVRR